VRPGDGATDPVTSPRRIAEAAITQLIDRLAR
jgi:hypothetical protein